MNDTQLQRLMTEQYQFNFPTKKYKLKAEFYSTKSLRHTISLRSGQILIRISELFRSVPEEILALLGVILLAKIFRYRVERDISSKYREYVREHVLPQHPLNERRPSPKYTAAGKYYDLNEIFDSINLRFFNNKIQKPILGWSLNKSYGRLGFYSDTRNLLVISRIFDSRKAPLQVVEYLMYHEMLHIYLPARLVNGRKLVHTADFRKLEMQFPDFDKIQKWIKIKRYRL